MSKKIKLKLTKSFFTERLEFIKKTDSIEEKERIINEMWDKWEAAYNGNCKKFCDASEKGCKENCNILVYLDQAKQNLDVELRKNAIEIRKANPNNTSLNQIRSIFDKILNSKIDTIRQQVLLHEMEIILKNTFCYTNCGEISMNCNLDNCPLLDLYDEAYHIVHR